MTKRVGFLWWFPFYDKPFYLFVIIFFSVPLSFLIALFMISSPEPWQVGPGGQILDALGNVIGVFTDWRNAERVITAMTLEAEEIADLKEQVTTLEHT